MYNRKTLIWTLRYIFKSYSPSEFFERLSYEIDWRKGIKEIFNDLCTYFVRHNLIEDYNILKNLFRLDILKAYPEDYLPSELTYSQEEKRAIKRYREIQGRRIFRSSRVGVFDFDIGKFIFNNSLERGRYFYVF